MAPLPAPFDDALALGPEPTQSPTAVTIAIQILQWIGKVVRVTTDVVTPDKLNRRGTVLAVCLFGDGGVELRRQRLESDSASAVFYVSSVDVCVESVLPAPATQSSVNAESEKIVPAILNYNKQGQWNRD